MFDYDVCLMLESGKAFSVGCTERNVLQNDRGTIKQAKKHKECMKYRKIYFFAQCRQS